MDDVYSFRTKLKCYDSSCFKSKKRKMTEVKRRRRAEGWWSSVRMCHPYSPTAEPPPPEGPHTWSNMLCHHHDTHNTFKQGALQLVLGLSTQLAADKLLYLMQQEISSLQP